MYEVVLHPWYKMEISRTGENRGKPCGVCKTIRIFNGCEVRIENSVNRTTVWHHKSCSYPEWRKFLFTPNNHNWTASSEFGTYRLCEQRRFRRACASAQSRQNLRCSLIQAVNQEEPSDRKPDPWPLWMAGHAQLEFVMTECSKTQIRLTQPNYWFFFLRRPLLYPWLLHLSFNLCYFIKFMLK